MESQLILSSDSPVDFHMHTTYSDGQWPAEQLINFLADEGFQLVAVTDHDRVDKVASIQALGAERNLTVLSGVEISTQWHGKMADLLCYGFDPQENVIQPLVEQIVHLQLANAHAVHEKLLSQGYAFPRQAEILSANAGQIRNNGDNVTLLREHGYASDWGTGLTLIEEAGYKPAKVEISEAVEAVHSSGGVCLIAHPGRQERNFTFYHTELLDQVRAEVPIDGIEVIHPTHTPELVETYLAYAREHKLLQSTGSDSHCHPKRMPKKHRAEISRALLERVGFTIQ